MNPFSKDKVVNACKELLAEIEKEREKEISKATSGKKKYGFFGPVLTRQEALDRMKPLERLLLTARYARQEERAKTILHVAELCAGETINLSMKDFDTIGSWLGHYEV